MYLQVIYSTLSIIAIPMLLTSIQIAIENPGLPLGLSDITPGWKKKSIQAVLMVFFPVTILLLRLQQQLTLKKRERIQDGQNYYLLGEFDRLNKMLMKMEAQRMKAMKMDIAFEVCHQIFLNICLVLFATSDTRTETGMEALFNNEGKDDFSGISNLTLFVISTIISVLSFVCSFITVHANHSPWKTKVVVGVYGILNLALRNLGMIVAFISSLGLMNVLRHYQAERIPFRVSSFVLSIINSQYSQTISKWSTNQKGVFRILF